MSDDQDAYPASTHPEGAIGLCSECAHKIRTVYTVEVLKGFIHIGRLAGVLEAVGMEPDKALKTRALGETSLRLVHDMRETPEPKESE